MKSSGPCDPKVQAARGALELVSSLNPSIVGVGTSTTVGVFIEEGYRAGLFSGRRLVASSIDTMLRLRGLGIAPLDPSSVEGLDVYVDGADEVDARGRAVKGRGGALLGEKVMAFSSGVNVFIVSEEKLVDKLGSTTPVPIEVVPFSLSIVLRALARRGFRAEPRASSGKAGPVISDWGGVIVDVHTGPMSDPELVEREISSIPGVVETGLFIGYADYVIVGRSDCTWEALSFGRKARG
jgi:ribose 5-phosphate isomerase A